MRGEEDERAEPPPAPGLARAIRDAVARYIDEIVVFLVVNVGWTLLFALFAFLAIGVPLLVILAPLLALPTAALTRLAVAAARDRAVTLPMAIEELSRLAGRKVLFASAQLLILAVSLTNVFVAGGIGGLPGILGAVVAGYALIATTLYAVALWPIVCDPDREGPIRDQLRLAMAVVVLRPLQLGVLGLITALAVIVSIQLIVPAIFLPSIVILAVAAYVVPVADRIREPAA